MIACYHDNSSDGEKYTKLCTDFWVDIRHSKRKFHYGTFWISIGIRPYRRSAASYVLLINKAIFITATIEKENKFNCKGIEFEIEIRNKVKEKLWIILN